MKINADYHTHTRYSDGIGKIEDNVKAAKEKGLKQIAITDHGFGHRINGIKRTDIIKIKSEIERLRDLYEIDILLGLEGNLLGRDGSIDITKDDAEDLDILLIGFHVFGKPKTWAEKFKFFYPNFFSKFFWYTKKRIEINTQAYLKAINNNNIDIITHLGHGMKVDSVRVAKACADNDVHLELNGKRIQFSRNEIQKVVDTGVKFIINSDAHTPFGVGRAGLGLRYAQKHSIPHDQIVNIGDFEKLKLKNHKRDAR